GELNFSQFDNFSAVNQIFHEAAGYVNVVILTARLDAALYERILYGTNNGHSIAVLFFESQNNRDECEKIFALLPSGSATRISKVSDE
ncbi:MAG: hypothetical protein FWD19_06295, partial [Defluviitaleaceae bacterium]|nr:hypothetical protein [Defluviitaleaceae bacterium]